MREIVLAWGVPAVFLAFALGFALLIRFGTVFRWWSASFVLAAVGYGLTILPSAPGTWGKPLFEDAFFLLALAGTNVAFARRAGRAPRPLAIAAIVLGALASAAVALVAFGDARYEIFSIQTGCALLMLLAAGQMRHDRRGAMDPVLFWLCIVIAASLMGQNAMLVATPSEPLTVANWRGSSWGFVFQFTGAATGVLIAFCVLVASGLDIIGSLREASQLDALTHVLNRRGLEQRVAQMRGCFPDVPFGLVVADLDHFKRINDRFGHAAGDAALCGFAALLEELAGPRGCVARLGGEEFAIVLAHRDLAATVRLAERVRTATAKVAWPNALAGVRITASLGVVDWRAGEALATAIARADRLLYGAKAAGRDRVACPPPLGTGPAVAARPILDLG